MFDDKNAGEHQRRRDRRRQEHLDGQREARRPPAQRRLLRRRLVPDAVVQEHQGDRRGRQEVQDRGRPHACAASRARWCSTPSSSVRAHVGVGGQSWGGKAGFTATTVVNRQDFHINWNKALDSGGLMLDDKVTLVLNIEANQVADAAQYSLPPSGAPGVRRQRRAPSLCGRPRRVSSRLATGSPKSPCPTTRRDRTRVCRRLRATPMTGRAVRCGLRRLLRSRARGRDRAAHDGAALRSRPRGLARRSRRR